MYTVHARAALARTFEKQCLDKHGVKVDFLQSERDFTSAFGHKKRGVQVRIPVSFGGHRGEVVSTEMPDCSTPLLLSLSAQVALDAVFHAKARLWELRSLGVTLPLHPMGGHLGVRVDDFEESETDKRARNEQPSNVSEKGDLTVFLSAAEAPDESLELVFSQEADEPPKDEAFNSADRGILVSDSRGTIKHGQRRRLDKACQLMKAADRRDWHALRQVRPAAERFCTANYQTTVIFEPFGGEFVVTRFGAKRFGWNNSQPLDIKHNAGYDLTTGAGRRLLYEVLDKHWPFLTVLAFPCTVWSIMNNLNQDPDLEQRRQKEKKILTLVLRVCQTVMERQRYFVVEQPWSRVVALRRCAGTALATSRCLACAGRPVRLRESGL